MELVFVYIFMVAALSILVVVFSGKPKKFEYSERAKYLLKERKKASQELSILLNELEEKIEWHREE